MSEVENVLVIGEFTNYVYILNGNKDNYIVQTQQIIIIIAVGVTIKIGFGRLGS